jgi:hypothetical protein
MFEESVMKPTKPCLEKVGVERGKGRLRKYNRGMELSQ